jgi:uncharacterized protein YjiK
MLKINYYLFFFYLGIFSLTSCSDDDALVDNIPDDSLELITSYQIDVVEPSGLTIDEVGSFLYVVSDNSGHIYKLSTEGVLIETYSYKGDDLEGVTTYKENKLLIAEERTKQIVEYDLSTGITSKHTINYENNFENNGIEGIAYKENDRSTFMLNEKNPGKLIRLRSDFTTIIEYDLNFASDYSGIFYDSSINNLWILSDESNTLNRCTLQGVLIEEYPINIAQAEGVAITKDKIFIVSDAESRLYVYKKP